MPIYAYRCESCGFEKDVLQKMSDAPLTQCPECSKETFRKQVTAAGFQLKGSGWYVTDFRGGANASNGAKSGDAASGEPAKADSGKSDAGSSESASSASASAAPATSTTSAAAAPAATSSTSA
ncbi:zinc ribbon domain-containing protein [Trinickia terrae]|uniref:Zinc ribbon domain-containing protein n=1 Tax=Trinickia terrae TaxID=2571161 RepID=A0A4U1I878_9BURK|nr:FmdB family zinc ribbon protein [Trinickia terrae]TKC89653.1 zinc ribbon domain-containing protein [Trinickia terrae]